MTTPRASYTSVGEAERTRGNWAQDVSLTRWGRSPRRGRSPRGGQTPRGARQSGVCLQDPPVAALLSRTARVGPASSSRSRESVCTSIWERPGSRTGRQGAREEASLRNPSVPPALEINSFCLPQDLSCFYLSEGPAAWGADGDSERMGRLARPQGASRTPARFKNTPAAFEREEAFKSTTS